MHGDAKAQDQIDPLYPNRSLPGGGGDAEIYHFVCGCCLWVRVLIIPQSVPQHRKHLQASYCYDESLQGRWYFLHTFTALLQSPKSGRATKMRREKWVFALNPLPAKNHTSLKTLHTFEAFSGTIVIKMTSEPKLAWQLDCSANKPNLPQIQSPISFFVVVTKQESSSY